MKIYSFSSTDCILQKWPLKLNSYATQPHIVYETSGHCFPLMKQKQGSLLKENSRADPLFIHISILLKILLSASCQTDPAALRARSHPMFWGSLPVF